MAKSYPIVGSARKRDAWVKNPKGAPKCIAFGCDFRATHRVDVEVNWFRGDDEVGNACQQHKDDAEAVLNGIELNKAAQRAQAQKGQA